MNEIETFLCFPFFQFTKKRKFIPATININNKVLRKLKQGKRSSNKRIKKDINELLVTNFCLFFLGFFVIVNHNDDVMRIVK